MRLSTPNPQPVATQEGNGGTQLSLWRSNFEGCFREVGAAVQGERIFARARTNTAVVGRAATHVGRAATQGPCGGSGGGGGGGGGGGDGGDADGG